jgi:uncharacterized small protein (DUF1192 family)
MDTIHELDSCKCKIAKLESENDALRAEVERLKTRMVKGGDGSHFPGCEESHWDCRIKKLEAENEQLTRQRDAARDGVSELTRMMMYRNELLDEKHAEIVKLRAEVERLRFICRKIHDWCGTDDAANALPFEPPWYQELYSVLRGDNA